MASNLVEYQDKSPIESLTLPNGTVIAHYRLRGGLLLSEVTDALGVLIEQQVVEPLPDQLLAPLIHGHVWENSMIKKFAPEMDIAALADTKNWFET